METKLFRDDKQRMTIGQGVPQKNLGAYILYHCPLPFSAFICRFTTDFSPYGKLWLSPIIFHVYNRPSPLQHKYKLTKVLQNFCRGFSFSGRHSKLQINNCWRKVFVNVSTGITSNRLFSNLALKLKRKKYAISKL